MVKIKREISTEGAPIVLQRRHTVVEEDKGCHLTEPKLKSITRSNSTSSPNQIKTKDLKEIVRNRQADTTLSPQVSISASNASTVVITDSELSSSWIYSSRKAQIKTSPVASNFNSTSRLAQRKEEIRPPMLPHSKMGAKDITSRPTKTSYCWNALVILIIGIAALGILAAIASIYYIEYFASYNATDIQITTKRISQDSIPLKKVGNSLGAENRNVLNHTELPGKTSEDLFPDSSVKGLDKATSTVKPSIDRIPESKNNVIENVTDSSSMLIGDLLNLTSHIINSVNSDPNENLINALFSESPNLESHYSKLFESYQGLHSVGNNNEKSIESEPKELISETIDTTNINDSNSMRLLEDENSNIEEINFDASSDEDKTPFQPAKTSSIVENAIEDAADETVKDSSMISEDTNDLFGAADDVASDLSVAEDMSTEVSVVDVNSSHLAGDFSLAEDTSTDLPVVDDGSSHFSLNLIEKDSQKDIPNISTELESTHKNMTELKPGDIELKTLPDDLENIETLSPKPLPSLSEDHLETQNLFRTLNIDFEEDKIPEVQPTDSEEEPLANLPVVGTANRSIFFPNFLSRLDRTWGFSNFLRNPDENVLNDAHQEQTSVSADDTDSVDLNRPILETDIAVPRPVEISRRFGTVNNENKDKSDLTQPDTFSLERALERLRSLNVDNILESSSKTDFEKKKEESKIQNNQEVDTASAEQSR